MKKYIYPSVLILVLFSIILGVGYPLAMTSVGQLLWSDLVAGSPVKHQDQVVGSALIGQKWESQKYFHGRNSASGYTPSQSGASNLSPLSQSKVKNDDSGELNTASGSGLDPHISPKAALSQISKIARERKISEQQLVSLINSRIESKSIGFLGQERINVLRLNLDLDTIR